MRPTSTVFSPLHWPVSVEIGNLCLIGAVSIFNPIIMVEETFYLDPTKVKVKIRQFYNNLCCKQFSWWSKVDGLTFDSTGKEEANSMEREFGEDEVLELKHLNGDKALRPNR